MIKTAGAIMHQDTLLKSQTGGEKIGAIAYSAERIL
jgi:hypothetical protein